MKIGSLYSLKRAWPSPGSRVKNGALLAGLGIGFLQIEANPLSNWLTLAKTRNVEKRSWLKQHLIANMASTGLFPMGAI